MLVLPLVAQAAVKLDPAAVVAWDEYIRNAEARAQQRLQPGNRFLWIEESSDLLAKVKRGEIVAVPMNAQGPRKVPSGLVHHWIGAVFIPNATLAETRQVLRDYGNYKQYFPDNVLEAKAIEIGTLTDRSSLVLRSQSYYQKSALDAEYESNYVPLDEHHLFSTTRTTHIQEVRGYGSSTPRILNEGEGSGVIWKLFSMTRYLERDGGVYMEVEAIVLSRDIPTTVRWIVDPIVKRVSRSSLLTSLRQTETAVSKRMEVRLATPASKGKAFAGR